MDFPGSILNETAFLAKIRENAAARKIPVLDYNAGRFLEAICFIKKPERVLEIGCGIGFSTYFLLKHFTGMPAGIKTNTKNFKYLYTGIDLNKKRLEEAKHFIKKTFTQLYGSSLIKINFVNGNALEAVPGLEEKYDFVFIDAAKFEYSKYLAAVEPKMEKGALLIADNIFYSGKIFNSEISSHDRNSVQGLKEFIEIIKSGKKYISEFYDIADGISISVFK